MTQANTEAALQSAVQRIVVLNAAQAVGVAWHDTVRRNLVWAALSGPSETLSVLAGLTHRVINNLIPLRESREDGWSWGAPVESGPLRGAVVAIGSATTPWQPELLGLLSDISSLAIDLAAEQQRTARLQRWLTTSGRTTAIGNLVTGLAQRINNPLTTIIGEAQLLKDEAFSSTSQDSLAAIERAGLRIQTAVEAVVRFTQNNGAAELTDVNATVEAALSLVTSQLEGAGVRLTARLAPNLPVVHANAAALTEAWVHLLINARRAIPVETAGEVRLTTTARDRYVLVSIGDSGPVTVRRRRLVQPYAADTRSELFLAWDIVTRMGGQMIVASRPSLGTTIGVRLPHKGAQK